MSKQIEELIKRYKEELSDLVILLHSHKHIEPKEASNIEIEIETLDRVINDLEQVVCK